VSGITSRARPPRGVFFRIVWTVAAIFVVETFVCGAAMLPAVAMWIVAGWIPPTLAPRVLVYSVIAVPSYVAFALALMIVSPLATWLTGARTAPGLELRIADMDWSLLRWARYVTAIHVVRVFAGTLFRGSPLWTAYLRLNGARIGRRVYVNTLFISDHNLLDFGDDVVIGSEVHISGHTVEHGVVKTAPVVLGNGVTVGSGSVIEIDVTVEPHCQIGALSFVPKHTTLPGEAVYVGAPVRRLESNGARHESASTHG
jgi:acetyltransferase-like isoleucine patch superfamily enzyme